MGRINDVMVTPTHGQPVGAEVAVAVDAELRAFLSRICTAAISRR
jgi:hypothetical protein